MQSAKRLLQGGTIPMTTSANIDHPFFSAVYGMVSRTGGFRRQMDPWRKQLAALASGAVLEVGAGGGQNFVFYDPAVTASVEATEPSRTMLRAAEKAAATARVPIHLTPAMAEQLPFPDAHFDSVLATLVFCSVNDPAQGLAEIRRVLKPGGRLLLLEHVRNARPGWARLQDWLTPIQRRVAGNCHLNRDTLVTVRTAGFTVQDEFPSGGGIHPMVAIVAMRPE
jgi:SAM-dependent methyltransferase